MEPKDLKLPETEYVATLPTGFDKIWKILWSIDPAHLKGDIGISLGKIALNHQIQVSTKLSELHAADAKAIQEMMHAAKLG